VIVAILDSPSGYVSIDPLSRATQIGKPDILSTMISQKRQKVKLSDRSKSLEKQGKNREKYRS
jgi:hypothetical protein